MSAELQGYEYHLPKYLIAAYPAAQRAASRLLVYRPGKKPELEDKNFCDIVNYLEATDTLIVNNARVSPRRLWLRRASQTKVEVLFLKELADRKWQCLLRGRHKLKELERLFYPVLPKHPAFPEIEFIFFNSASLADQACLLPVLAGSQTPAWQTEEQAEQWFAAYGETPIPPYLGRPAETLDRERYQTVYAHKPGSVAAPTAGLHFSTKLLTDIRSRGVSIQSLTLRLGYGSFAPLQAWNFLEDRLHNETYSLSPELAQLLNQTKGRKIAVGSSSLRALESNFRCHTGRFVGGNFTTELFLRPPERLLSVNGLLTNFHLPKSSLLLLVAAYVGKENILRVYKHAVRAGYRFFSYGDAMLILT